MDQSKHIVDDVVPPDISDEHTSGTNTDQPQHVTKEAEPPDISDDVETLPDVGTTTTTIITGRGAKSKKNIKPKLSDDMRYVVAHTQLGQTENAHLTIKNNKAAFGLLHLSDKQIDDLQKDLSASPSHLAAASSAKRTSRVGSNHTFDLSPDQLPYGHSWSMDSSGRQKFTSLDNFKYFLVLVCKKSSYVNVQLTKSWTAAEQTRALKAAVAEIRALPNFSKNLNDYEIYNIELDQATSFTGDLAREIFAELQIKTTFTSKEHRENGLVLNDVFRPSTLPVDSQGKSRKLGVPVMLLLTCKTDSNNIVVRLKSRLVLVGSQSKRSYSDLERYAPVMSSSLFNAMLVYGIQNKLQFTSADVMQAFTNSLVSENATITEDDTYVKLPKQGLPGIVLQPGQNCYKLNKLSYGHSLASIAWFETLLKYISEFSDSGIISSQSERRDFFYDMDSDSQWSKKDRRIRNQQKRYRHNDIKVYMCDSDSTLLRIERGDECVLISLYVDDLWMCHSPNSMLMVDLMKFLQSKVRFGTINSTDSSILQKFEGGASKVAPLTKFLGVNLTFSDDCVKLDQIDKIEGIWDDYKTYFEPLVAGWESGCPEHEIYIRKYLNNRGFHKTSKKTPLSSERNFDISEDAPQNDEERRIMQSVTYRSLVARLAQVWSRRDLKYAIHMVSRFQQNPGIANFTDCLRILRYCYHTRHDTVLTYRRTTNAPTLIVMTDSSWSQDVNTSRSISGICFTYGQMSFDVVSHLQSIITRSSCECEYMALSEGARQAEYYMWIFRFLGHSQIKNFTVLTDSQSSIDMSSNLVGARKRSRHFRIRIHDVRQMIADKMLILKFVRTNCQLADYFTKILPVAEHERLRDIIMGLVNDAEVFRDHFLNVDVVRSMNRDAVLSCRELRHNTVTDVGWCSVLVDNEDFLDVDCNVSDYIGCQYT